MRSTTRDCPSAPLQLLAADTDEFIFQGPSIPIRKDDEVHDRPRPEQGQGGQGHLGLPPQVRHSRRARHPREGHRPERPPRRSTPATWSSPSSSSTRTARTSWPASAGREQAAKNKTKGLNGLTVALGMRKKVMTRRNNRFGCDDERYPPFAPRRRFTRSALGVFGGFWFRLHTFGRRPSVWDTARTDRGSRRRVNESRHCSQWPFHIACRSALAVKCSIGGFPEAHASCGRPQRP